MLNNKTMRNYKSYTTYIPLLLLMLLPSHIQAGSMIRVLQFNIRYMNTSDGINIWANRRQEVMTFVRNTEADVFGLQEAVHAQVQQFQASMKEYAMIGEGRDGGTGGEWNPIFYLKEKYELKKSGTFWLSDTPEVKGSNTWGAACRRIMTWVILKSKETGEEFLYANTHFDHVGVTARRESAKLIMRKIQEIVGEQPAVVTGDFNVTEDDEAYTTMLGGEKVNGKLVNCKFLDAYHMTPNHTGTTYTWHQFCQLPPMKREKIDFIFLTPDIRCLRCVTDDETSHPCLLSDHVPVYADIELP